jgi:hypothetical protein
VADESPCPADLQAAVLVGDTYYAAKARLLAAEQTILRLLHFQLLTPRPHAYLLNLARLLGASHAAVAAAVCLLNDACVYTTLLLDQPPQVLAVASMQLALQLLQQEPQTPCPEGMRQQLQAQWDKEQQQQRPHSAQEQEKQQQCFQGHRQELRQANTIQLDDQAQQLLPDSCTASQQMHMGGRGLSSRGVQQLKACSSLCQQQQEQGPGSGSASSAVTSVIGSVGPSNADEIQNRSEGANGSHESPTMRWVAALDVDQAQVVAVTLLLWNLVETAWNLT